MTTEPMKRYSPPKDHGDGESWPVTIPLSLDPQGRFLDRRDMPVESLRYIASIANGVAELASDGKSKENLKQHIAALERLLGACEP